MESSQPSFPLHISHLSVGYPPGLTLFDNIEVSLSSARLTCLMGPNGAGKSTLLRVIAGLQAPMNGIIIVPDEKKIALVLTDRVTATHMTVKDLVSFGRYPHVGWGISFSAHDWTVVNQSLQDVGIAALTDQKIEALSDGQLQLAMIARALAQETPVLLLDEPTAHLDLNHRVEIMKLLLRLSREKQKAILLATHDLDLALQMADEVWLSTPEKKIKKGIPEDLVLDGSFDDIFQFKGFDLRTGKIEHLSFRKMTIHLQGDGPIYRWTKNALERAGYAVAENGVPVLLDINDSKPVWSFQNQQFENLRDLLQVINAVGVS